MGHLGYVHLSDEALNMVTGMRWGIVMQNGPSLVMPNHWTMASNMLPQVLEYLQIHPASYPKAVREELTVNNPILVEEQDQHQFLG